jgi:hypothetical protein
LPPGEPYIIDDNVIPITDHCLASSLPMKEELSMYKVLDHQNYIGSKLPTRKKRNIMLTPVNQKINKHYTQPISAACC